MYKCILIFLVFSGANPGKPERYLLPKTVQPLRYILTMNPNLSTTNPTFSGSVLMQLQILATTGSVTFHAQDLTITASTITLTSYTGGTVPILRAISKVETQTYTLHLRQALLQGESYNLTIGKFSGKLAEGEGFFMGRYRTSAGYRFMAGTHFQPKGARRAFPCFDEPTWKATFVINVIRSPEYYSLSNQELDRIEQLPNGRFKDIYKETPIMSTYIVAFSVLNFEATHQIERHRMYATSDVVQDLTIPLQMSVTMLHSLEEFTGINYKLPKLDHLIVPNGFIVDSAMENWGLILYQEKYVKYISSALKNSKRTTIYLAHELSHQWLGNLVTPQSWDYLWLSESFAAYLQYFIATQVQATWQLMDQFVIDSVHEGFLKEEELGAHPLTYPVPDSEKFPPLHILYEKGGSIVRMMVHFLSETVFKDAVRRHLAEGEYKCVVPSDLYSAIQDAVNFADQQRLLAGLTVTEIMNTWEVNSGYPIVTASRNYKTGLITLTQNSPFKKGVLWHIPINYVHSSNPNFTETTADFWLTAETATLEENVATTGWIVVNKQQTGRYRVNYDLENWNRIIDVLHSDDFKSIHVLNRAQLINDAFYLAFKNIIPVKVPLTMSEYLVREKDYVPFAAFYNGVSNYLYTYNGKHSASESEFFRNHMLKDTVTPQKPGDYSQEYKIFQQYVRYIMNNIRAYLGPTEKPSDTFLDKMNRIAIDQFFPYYFDV